MGRSGRKEKRGEKDGREGRGRAGKGRKGVGSEKHYKVSDARPPFSEAILTT